VKTLEEIQRRKAILVARSERQREEIGVAFTRLEQPVRIGEQLLRFFRKPLVITGLAALLLKTRWKRLAKWPGLLWRAWQFLGIFRQARS
jgi:hypothetical protein